MKIAIWGSYNFGNYGDDTMAIQLSKFLKDLNVDPMVYLLDKSLANKHSIDTTDSVDELIRGASFCIIGGGSMLANNLPESLEKEFHKLYDTLKKYGCQIFPISIGGEGLGKKAPLSFWRNKLFSDTSCKWSTVRLKSDVESLSILSKKGYYYPDILLSVRKTFDIKNCSRSDDGKLHIGIHIPKGPRANLLMLQIRLIARIRKNIVFHFIKAYLPNSTVDIEFLPELSSANIKKHVYSDPTHTSSFISSLDLLVSYKLHLGVTALALGVPFLSIGGASKTREFLRSMDADFAIWRAKDKNLRLIWLLSKKSNIVKFRDKFDFKKINQMIDLSFGHLDRLRSLVKLYG
jgi:hypothetical protein